MKRLRVKRNGFTFEVQKEEVENGTASSFFLKKGNELVDTRFVVYNDGKYITLQNKDKDYHEYITYAMKVNKFRMIDNIIERMSV